MTFELFERPYHPGGSTEREFRKMYTMLKINPESHVLWTGKPHVARWVTKRLGIRSELSITADKRSTGTIIKLRKGKQDAQ